MTQSHLDRLTAVDASFLSNESSASHMHIGALLTFEGPPPDYDELLEHIRSRLHLVPRYRQKLAIPPAESGRPFWIDDPHFNLEYHVRASALPKPQGETELRRLTARIYSQQLDKSKPLWELWLIQGLRKKRFALVSKTHHAVVDGVSGVDIGTVLFDLQREPSTPAASDDWVARPEPSGLELAARGWEGAAKTPLRIARKLVSAATDPGAALSKAAEAAEGVGDVAWALANPAPEVPLNTKIGSHRRFVWNHAELEQFKLIKRTFGGTVNDVVLTVVSGALRRWLRNRAVAVDGLELRALVPVSIRGEDAHGQLGNQIAAVRGPLPVYVADPVQRLRVVCEEMDDVKASNQALGAEVISRLNDFAPPTLLAQASRLNFSTRLFNLIVTNVPGPQIPLYMLGNELLDVFPIAFLPEDHALAIAIMSYNGGINFGLLADYDSVDDILVLHEGLKLEIRELHKLAVREAKRLDAEGADATGAESKAAS